jgi:hypothetical protein
MEEEFKEATFRYVEAYFSMLKAARYLEDKIPNLKTREEKIEAFKAYFKLLEVLREHEPVVKKALEIL